MTSTPPGRREFLGLMLVAVVVVVGVLLAVSVFGDQAPETAGDQPTHTAGDAGSAVAAGRAMAEANCARCHAVGADDDSPVADAPPFRTLSQKWPVEHLEEALAEGIVVGHETVEMPEFVFEPDQIGDFIAYLKSLDG